MKKFICLILVLSLLFSSVGAVEVYEVEPDTKVSLMSSAVTLAEVTDTQLDNLFRQYFLGSSTIETVGYLLDQIFGHVSVIRSALDSGTSPLFYIRSGSYLNSTGGQSTVTSSNIYLGELVRSGFLGLKNVIENQSQYDYSTVLSQILTSVDNVYSRLNTVNSSVGNVNSSVGQVNTSVGQVNTSVGQVNTSVGQVNTSVGQVNSSLVSYLGSSGPLYELLNRIVVLPAGVYLGAYGSEFTAGEPIGLGDVIASGIRGIANSFRAWSGWTVLGSSGDETVLSSDLSFSQLVDNGFLGLRSLMTVPSGSSYLGSSGSMVTSSSDLDVAEILKEGFGGIYSLSYVNKPNYVAPDGTVKKSSGKLTLDNMFRDFALGVRSLVAGSEADNIYSGTSINNENLSSSFDATGLGPMLHTWLGDIQNDLGVLSYVFASPQDLELKKESESNMDAVSDNLLSSDSKSSVKVKDITSISSASDSIQELGETGVTPGQAFEQLGNSDLFSFFSAETAANLDTTVSTYSRDPSQQIVTSYYEENRLEFFDVIGKEVGW